MEGREMKKKALLVVLLVVMGLAVFSIANAEIAPPWYTCKISQVGSNRACNMVTLSDMTSPIPLFTNVTFTIDKDDGKDMYSAALTAFASGYNVLVFLNGRVAGSKCLALYATQ
jgi:hypothetical protein